jgi:hypothetical protein
MQLINNFQRIYSNDLILFLIEQREIEIVKQAYELLDADQKYELNCSGFAFFKDEFDLNLLNLNQLGLNIKYCYDDKILIKAISKVNKATIIVKHPHI